MGGCIKLERPTRIGHTNRGGSYPDYDVGDVVMIPSRTGNKRNLRVTIVGVSDDQHYMVRNRHGTEYQYHKMFVIGRVPRDQPQGSKGSP
jgi:hypothetical protein